MRPIGSFRRNVAWNLAGQVLPLAVALVSFPVIIAALGPARFGLVAVAWVIIGYFGLLDLGIGRALTKTVAERVQGENRAEVPALVATGVAAMSALGLIGTVVLWSIAPSLAEAWLKIPPDLQRESWLALCYLAASIPVVIVTTGLRGVLEGLERFDLVNLLRVPLALWLYLAPLIALPFTHAVDEIVLLLIAGRVVALAAHAWACAAAWPGLWQGMQFDRSLLNRLLAFGGWVTVSNVISPLMTYFDRFVIGAVVSIAAVAYYAIPHEVVFRLTVVAEAIAAVLFAATSSSLAHARVQVSAMSCDALRAIVYLLFVPLLACVIFAREALSLWLGPQSAAESFVVLQILAVGILFNSAARVPFALLQAAGRPDLTAKLHLLEAVPYGLLLWQLVVRYGINGAAAAWTIRVLVDTALLVWLSERLVAVSPLARVTISHLGVCLAVMLAGALVSGTANKLVFLSGITVLLGVWCWRLIRARSRTRSDAALRKA